MWFNIQFFSSFPDSFIIRSYSLVSFTFLTFSCLSVLQAVSLKCLIFFCFPVLWLWFRNTLLNTPALLFLPQLRSQSSTDLVLPRDSTAAFSSFSYLLRVFFLSEFGLCGCQGTHLLPQSHSILIACRFPNTTFVLSNALQKLSCIVILLSLVSQQFFFCKFDSFWSILIQLFCLSRLPLLLGTCPSMLSYVTIFRTLFFSLPLCNCIVTLLLKNCNSFI